MKSLFAPMASIGLTGLIALTVGLVFWPTDQAELFLQNSFSATSAMAAEKKLKAGMVDPKTGKKIKPIGWLFFLRNS